MSYGVRFEGKVLVQLSGMPQDFFGAMVECVVCWSMRRGLLLDVRGDPAYRQVVFGRGLGLLSFRVDDAAELIRIFGITWIG